MGQLSFADVDPLADVSLKDTTFVVVDLETTGGRASGDGDNVDAITEIGAVKVRGGEVLGELATLVDPGRSIPPQIVELTGITSAMVRNAPKIDSVLPAFLEFSRGAVLVAHNAGFDIGFLRAAAERCQNRVAAPTGAVHRQVGPARAHPRRGAECEAIGAGPVVRRRNHTDAPGTRRRAGHRRRAARSHRAGRQPGRSQLHRPARLPARRVTATAPQASACRQPSAPARRLSVPRTGQRGALRRHCGGSAQTCGPVLQRFRFATAHQGDGRPRHRGRPRRMRTRPGGGRA